MQTRPTRRSRLRMTPVLGALLIAMPALAAGPTAAAPDPGGEATQPAPGPRSGFAALAGRTAAQLKGMAVSNLKGEEIGEVQTIARRRENPDSADAVISVGGLFGIGATEVAVPLDRLNLRQGRLVVAPAQSEDELIHQGRPYEPDDYFELADQAPLAAFIGVSPAHARGAQADADAGKGAGDAPPKAGSAKAGSAKAGSAKAGSAKAGSAKAGSAKAGSAKAGSAKAGSAKAGPASFESLDSDGSGDIDAFEARASRPLAEAWRRVDSDLDGAVDRAEFSAFEAGSKTPAAHQGKGQREREAAAPDAETPSTDKRLLP